MTITLLYLNNSDLRRQILEQLLPLVKNRDLSKDLIQHPMFRTLAAFPTLEELKALPLNIQIEQLEILNEKFICKRAFVIEVETVNPETALIKL